MMEKQKVYEKIGEIEHIISVRKEMVVELEKQIQLTQSRISYQEQQLIQYKTMLKSHNEGLSVELKLDDVKRESQLTKSN